MNIIFCGAGGAGKTTLLKDLQQKSKVVSQLPVIEEVARKIIKDLRLKQKDHSDAGNFINLQELILKEQSRIEDTYNHGFISDRCCMDALAYARFTGIQNPVKKFGEILPCLAISLQRYRRSLVILVCPLAVCEDDGVRKVMTPAESERFTDILEELLQEQGIPFLKLSTRDRQERQKIVMSAITGIQPITFSLQGPPEQLNLTFYLPRPNPRAIPTLCIYEDRIEQHWTHETEGKTSRFIEHRGNVEGLLILSFDRTLRSQVIKKKFLLAGVCLNEEVYNFLGCTASGVKGRRCFMMKGTPSDCHQVLQQNGNFERIRSVSKRLSRIGLLFSSVWLTGVEVKDVMELKDIENEKYNFTDGCGGLSPDLVQELGDVIRTKTYLPDHYNPTVYQIRYQGYKGVLALNPDLKGKIIQVRPSMKKFETSTHPQLGLCDFSRPNVFGHLNRQFIILLSGLGVPDQVLLAKQERYLALITNMTHDAESAVIILQWLNQPQLAASILDITGETPKRLENTVKQTQTSLVSKVDKLSILIPKSRNLFGICDPIGVLDYGECFLRIILKGQPHTVQGQVVICKNPCYLLGDVRVLHAVDPLSKEGVQGLEHLVDCLVFPTRGVRPHPNEIAGSDLDGDMYFVCWDEDLIPPTAREPYDYPSAQVTPRDDITVEDLIDVFARPNQRLIGRVDTLYRSWAELGGAGSQECERLGQLFSRVIDASKTGETVVIPKALDTAPVGEPKKDFVWIQMAKRAEIFKKEFGEKEMKSPLNPYGITTEFVVDMLKQDFSNLMEYEKFEFAWRHFSNLHEEKVKALQEFMDHCLDHVNFSLFTLDQKWEAFSMGIPKEIIYNGLNKSHIMTQEQLEEFNLGDACNPWHFHARLPHNSMNWNVLSRALTNFQNVLLVLQLPSQVKVIVQFNVKVIENDVMQMPPGSIEAYLYSENFGYRRRYCLGGSYCMELQKVGFQLYRQEKQRTFIWFNCEDDVLFDQKKGSHRRDEDPVNRISIDLSRFDANIYRDARKNHPRVRRVAFSDMEIFVADTPYLDILEGNFIDDVIECDVQETEDEDFEEKEVEIPRKELDLHCLINWLREVKANRNKVPLDELKAFVGGNLVTNRETLSEMAVSEMLDLIVMTSRLGLSDISRELGERLCDVSLEECLEILSSWQTWWYLGRTQSRLLISSVTRAKRTGWDAYFTHYATLHTLALLEEMETSVKDVETPRSIANLKIARNPISGENPSNIELYKTGALGFKCKISKGQYVEVQLMADPTVCFLGRVVIFSSAPVSVSVEVVSSVIPNVVRESLLVSKAIHWRMTVVANIATFLSCHNAITKLKEITHHEDCPILSLIGQPGGQLHESPLYSGEPFAPPSIMPIRQDLGDLKELNKRQQEAVTSSLSQAFTLIQGPPGTGKTTVACAVVREAITIGMNGILVCAETNNAVDNIARKLAGKVRILRLGNIENISPDLHPFSLDGELNRLRVREAKTVTRMDEQGIERRNNRFVQKLITQAEVILVTCASANDQNLENKSFELVVCDEATLSREPTLWCALVHKPKRLVLIGDPQQLGPMDIDHQVLDDLPSLSLLSTTLFHRLHRQPELKTIFLDTQHRMHSALMDFPSTEFYDGKLKSGVSGTERPIPAFIWADPNRPLGFLSSVGSTEHKSGSSYLNENEAEKVLHCVKCLLNIDEDVNKSERLTLTSRDIGVITPYRGQVTCIKEKLCDFAQVEVNSVDGFQGREKDIIIVSTVRSNERRNLGFTDDARRINVTLTRARRGFILIGNETTLRTSDIWRKWIEVAPRLDERKLQLHVDEPKPRNKDRGDFHVREQRRPRAQGRGSWGREGRSEGSGRGGGREGRGGRGGCASGSGRQGRSRGMRQRERRGNP